MNRTHKNRRGVKSDARSGSRRVFSLRKLGLESLEERQLLSASTLIEAAAISDLTSNVAVVAQQEEPEAAIDLSNAVADAILVTNTNDSGDGSLRQAIADANDGATIAFDSALYGQTITLSTPITIDKNLTIVGGEGDDRVTIDANGASEIFDVTKLDSPYAITVELNGLNLTNANSTYGAMRFSSIGGSLVVANCVFTNNSNATRDGGAIYVQNGSNITISDSVFTGNNANRGGAIFAQSERVVVGIENCRFEGNTAHNRGGALYIHNGSGHTVKNTTFVNNDALNRGGAWYLDPNTSAVFECVGATGNTAPHGAVGYANDADMIVKSSLIADNQSGFFLDSYAHGDFTNVTLANNGTHAVDGQRSTIEIRNSIVYGNDLHTQHITLHEVCNSVLDEEYHPTGSYDGNIVYGETDVIFIDAANGDYNLANGSIAIDIGNNAYVNDNQYDYRGAPFQRIVRVVDAGAYEHQEEASIVVTTTEDVVDPTDGKISLREAVEVYFAYENRYFDANVDPTGKTVTFNLGSDPGAVLIDSGEITIAESMGIYGGNATTTIDAQSASRIFKVSEGVNAVDFEKLKLTNGVTVFADTIASGSAYDETLDAYNGGAIYADATAITVKDSEFWYNEGYIGGAIFVNGGTIDVENSVFEWNKSRYQGGAIALYSAQDATQTSNDLTVNRGWFRDNSSDRAGGIYFKDGTAALTDSIFHENAADYANGGAITVANSTLTAADVSMTANRAERFGGAIFAADSNVTINNASEYTSFNNVDKLRIGHNTANYGGAIYTTKGSLQILAGLFNYNEASVSGGSIYAANDVTVTAVFENDFAGENGGSVYSNADLTITDSRFYSNFGQGSGGAVYAIKGDVTARNSSFEMNFTWGSGGAIRTAKLNSATFDNATFTNNNASVAGGAIAASATKNLTLNGGTFTDNTAQNSGGAIYATTGVEVASNGVVYDHNISNKFGGAIAAVGGSVLTVADGSIGNCSAYAGGAVYAANSDAVILLATISDNTSTTYGAGVYSVDSVIRAFDSVFDYNTATYAGGAIFASKGTVAVENTQLTNNESSSFGGAISVNSGAKLSLAGATVQSNSATNSGGAIYANGSDVEIKAGKGENDAVVATTFSGNESSKFGGALCVVGGNATISDADFSNNSGLAGGAIYANGGLTLANAKFTTNEADSLGGAIYMKSGVANFDAVQFVTNTATTDGGALYLHTVEATLTDATFEMNTAKRNGGAIEMVNGSLTTATAIFADNFAQSVGGAIYQLHGTTNLSGATFDSNSATTKAGALYVGAGASTISGSTFSGNTAPRGTAILAISATSLEIDGEAFPTSGAIEEEDLSSALLDEAFAELFVEELD